MRRARNPITPAIYVAALLSITASPVYAGRSDLVSFLDRAVGMGSYTSPVRADIKITKDAAAPFEAVAIIDPASQALFFATKDSKWRALVPLSWKRSGKMVADAGKAPISFGVDDRLAATDLRAIDFFPYWTDSSYETAFISDNTRMLKTVTLYAPEKFPYILFVVTFNKEKLVPVATKYYVGAMNNLVRLRTDSEHVMVGARPRPQKIVINNYEDNTTTTYELHWKLLEAVPPGMMDESTFFKVSIDGQS